MDKKTKILFGVFAALVVFIYALNVLSPKPINWYPSYVSTHKIPYGTYILKEQMSSLFPKTKITEIRENPYVFLQDSTVSGTYFFVDYAINIDKEVFYKMADFVSRGNDVFISTNGINIDSLNLETKPIVSNALEEHIKLSLTNPNLKKTTINFDRKESALVFKKFDTLQTTVLGSIHVVNGKDKEVERGVNFIKYKFGKGQFYLHSFPASFTNYSLLYGDNSDYTAAVLSYLDDNKPILWDSYYKTGKSKISSPIYYVLSIPSLKYAYYSILTAVFIFVVFGGKRNQRDIRVIAPLKNQTLAFTRTIANMYYEKSNHKEIAEQSVQYFLDYIREKFQISTEVINQDFYEQLSAKSQNSLEEVKKLFGTIKNIESRVSITKNELMELNTSIEKFKKTN